METQPVTRSKRDVNAPPEVVEVGGEIGGGKTTFITILAAYLVASGLRVCVIPEPVEVWERVGILGKFYSDKERYCYEFQTFVIVSRLKRILEKYAEMPDADVYLLERSPYTDRYVFVEMLSAVMDESQKAMYLDWWEMWLKPMPFKINKFLYIKPDIDECMKRIEERHRAGEVDQDKNKKPGVTREYQVALRAQHEKYYARITGNTIVLDGGFSNEDFRVPGEAQRKILERAEHFILHGV